MMRNFSRESLSIAIFGLGIGAIGMIPAAAQGIAEEVMKQDEAYRIAKLNRDIPALDHILADSFNETNQNGNSRNKTQTLDLWKSFSITSLTTDSSEVRISGTTAMVTGKQTENGFERMLFTRVYILEGGGWRLLASMQFRDPHVEQGPSAKATGRLTSNGPLSVAASDSYWDGSRGWAALSTRWARDAEIRRDPKLTLFEAVYRRNNLVILGERATEASQARRTLFLAAVLLTVRQVLAV